MTITPAQGLKNHAVTMFEVGKLTDESMDSFLIELGKVSTVKSINYIIFLSAPVQFMHTCM